MFTIEYYRDDVALDERWNAYGDGASDFFVAPTKYLVPHEDVLGPDWAYVRESNWAIWAGGGNDTVYGSNANRADRLYGEEGDDWVYGMAGGDFIEGGTGNDHLDGGDDDDDLFGDSGNDHLDGGTGNDVLHGGGDADRLLGYDGDDQLFGDSGTDTLEGEAGNDLLDGGDGDDKVDGGDGNDTVKGGAGADWLDGGDGKDYLYGGLGDDAYIVRDAANDIVAEEAWDGGYDTVYVAQASYTLPAYVEEARPHQSLSGPVQLSGNADANWLYGTGHADKLSGLAGDDYLDGGAGNDTMNGGDGNDRYVVDAAGDSVIDTSGIDTVDSLLGAYVLPAAVENLNIVAAGSANGTGNELSNTLQGGSGNNVIDGRGGADSIDGGLGSDFLYGGEGNDSLAGGFDADWLFGENGTDTLRGDFGNDLLYGGAGQDFLYGGEGNDTLVGGAGRDALWGGNGSDTFRITLAGDSQTGPGIDRVVDFQKGLDRIDLSMIDADTSMPGNQAFSFFGMGAPMFTGAGDLWAVQGRDNVTRVFGDVNGDGVSDVQIEVAGLVTFSAADFGL